MGNKARCLTATVSQQSRDTLQEYLLCFDLCPLRRTQKGDENPTHSSRRLALLVCMKLDITAGLFNTEKASGNDAHLGFQMASLPLTAHGYCVLSSNPEERPQFRLGFEISLQGMHAPNMRNEVKEASLEKINRAIKHSFRLASQRINH